MKETSRKSKKFQNTENMSLKILRLCERQSEILKIFWKKWSENVRKSVTKFYKNFKSGNKFWENCVTSERKKSEILLKFWNLYKFFFAEFWRGVGNILKNH